MGLFDKPRPIHEAGKFEWPEDWNEFLALSDLFGGMPFRLEAVRVRAATTKFGQSNSVDLAARLIGYDSPRAYSGFSGGIVRMAVQAQDRDFPCWCRIEYKDTGKGNPTTILVPLENSEEAEAQLAVQADEDIPF